MAAIFPSGLVAEVSRNKGPDMGVESRGSDDESRGLDDKSHIIESDGLGLGEEEEAVPEGQQQVVLDVGTAVSAPLGLRSTPKSERPERVSASRQPTLTTWTYLEDGMVYIDVHAYPALAPPAQTPPSPEWPSGSLPISPTPSIVPLPMSSPMIPLTVPSPIATPATAETEGFLTKLGAQGENQELRLQLAEERHARLELAEIVDSMRRGQEPRGDM
ncbi:hypothetical protein Tco_0451237 [Tanacetum coccineum]